MNASANPAPGFIRHPGHKITTEPLGREVTVSASGLPVAKSSGALLLREGDYPPVIYIPFADIGFGRLKKSTTSTHCPFKGDASYWSLSEREKGNDVMWAYEAPFDEMLAIRDHGAFYGDRVDISVD